MMNKNGYLEDNNGYGIFKSIGILVRICMQFIKHYVIALSKMCLCLSLRICLMKFSSKM